MSGSKIPILHMFIWPGHEFDQLPPSFAEVKDKWSYTSSPPYVYMACTMTTLPFFIRCTHTHIYIYVIHTITEFKL
jgi:hypothetical protein